MTNPLLSDRDVEFLLYEVHGADKLHELDGCADFTRDTIDMFLGNVRRFARDVLFPTYRAMDQEPPRYVDGRMRVHPKMPALYRQLCELGMLQTSALPSTLYTVAATYLMAANGAAYGYMGLTGGAAHLIEAFGDDVVRGLFLEPMHRGRWTGTMALTEPQAGSSLADVKTRATPTSEDARIYRISGSKIFISGGDNDFADNTVHLALARIDGAPAGTKGISLFAVPRVREDGADNDVSVAGAIHKLGARGIPSCMINFGERGECRGWLVGEKHRGLAHMFQMMNEARILVGAGATAVASAAYHESLAYARVRTQGRPPSERDPARPPVPIIEHADVRRMLLRQKAIVEGSLSLVIAVAKLADVAAHAPAESAARRQAQLLLDLLTPVAKTFPSEKGFESNALAIQVHGGYGYSSEYLVEAWLRDQKLNTLHEGTSGIQALDLLGRKVVADGGAAMRAFDETVRGSVERARAAGVDGKLCDAFVKAWDATAAATMTLGMRGAGGDVEGMLRHSADYMELFGIVVIAWQWLEQAAAAKRQAPSPFVEGKLAAARYWLATELPRVEQLCVLCVDDEQSYARMQSEWF